MLFPYFSGTLGYCIYFLSSHYDDNIRIRIFSIFYLIFFVPYAVFVCFLMYIEGNSLVKPNPLFAEWFSGIIYTYPLSMGFTSLVCFCCVRLGIPIIIDIALSVSALIHIIEGVYIIYDIPYMNYVINELIATQMFSVAICSLVSIIATRDPTIFGPWPISITPIIVCVIFVIVHLISVSRRKPNERLVQQIDSSQNITVETLATTLSSLTTEMQFRIVIKSGLLSGSSSVTNITFVRFCLEKFPNSQWMLAYVVFLYSTVWGSDANTYKFLLHILSLEIFRGAPEILLFQNIYCVMQTAQDVSPIISRYLNQYRRFTLLLSRTHKEFWLTSTISLKDFSYTMNHFYKILQDQKGRLLDMYAMFPFSPAVAFERSIFLADFNHDYIESSKYYEHGNQLSRNGVNYVSNLLYNQFSSFFPAALAQHKLFKKRNDKGDYTFLSLRDFHDHARRMTTTMNTSDKYFNATSTFTIPRNQVIPKSYFFKAMIIIYCVTFSVMLLGYLAFLIGHHQLEIFLPNDTYMYFKIKNLLDQAVLFRKNIAVTQFDIMLISAVLSRKYENFTSLIDPNHTISPDDLYWFTLTHLNMAVEETNRFKYLIDTFQPVLDTDIRCFNCTKPECAFLPLYMDFHEYCILFYQSRSINITHFEESKGSFYMLINALSDVTQKIYYAYADYEKLYTENTFQRNWAICLILPFSEIILCLVGSLTLYVIFQNVKNSMFSIIRTVQPPELKFIASQFDKVLSFEEHQTPESGTYKPRSPLIFFIISTVFLFLFPFIVLIIIIFKENTMEIPESLPPLPKVYNSNLFVYYSYAVLEYQINMIKESNDTDKSFLNYTSIEEIYGTDIFCIHHMFNITYSNDTSMTNEFYETFSVNEFLFYSYFTAVVSFIFLILFIITMTRNIDILYSTRILLYFIPMQAAQSNPVFSTLRDGGTVSLDEVKQFSDDLKTVPINIDFFCALFLDTRNKITKSVGDVRKFLHIEPRSLTDLNIFLNNNATCKEGTSFDNFFQTKPLTPIYLSIENGAEIAMNFTTATELFVRDASHNQLANKKKRTMQKISSFLNDIQKLRNMNTEKVVIIYFSAVNKQLATEILKIKEAFPIIIPFDQRNEALAFFISISEHPDANNLAISFLQSLREILTQIKCTVDAGGPLVFLDQAKSNYGKSRCICECYDRARLITLVSRIGENYLTKDYLAITDIDISVIQLIDLHVADDCIVEATPIIF